MSVNVSQTKKAARISLFISFIVLALKFVAYFQTSSTAILSDAIETITNVVTAIVALIVLKYALAPADEDHPYGHGKLEYFSASFEGGIILFAAFAIIFESVRSLILGNQIDNLNTGLFYIIIASIINFIAGTYLKSVGKKQNSEALKASGSHLMADVKTTAGIIVGLTLYQMTGILWIDPLIGILVGLWLVFESVQIIKKNIGGLLDETDLSSVDQLSEKIEKNVVPEIIDIHNLRIIRSGSFHHIDAHLVVPQFLEIHLVHELIHEFEKKVVSEYNFDGEFAFHTDPCYQKYCSACEVKVCPLRKSEFAARRKMNPRHLISGPQFTEDDI
jgi:cation diffusion facilitator family transporter